MGCNSNNKFDDTDLIRLSEKDKLPINYTSNSTKQTIDALPFKVHLPKTLPKGFTPLKTDMISDINGDGKSLLVLFTSLGEETGEIFTIMINTKNARFTGESEKVTLKNDIEGLVSGGSLSFKLNGITYLLDLIDYSEDENELNKQVISIANQMIP